MCYLTAVAASEPYCMKCGTRENLRPDPNIEDMFFCEDCWEERAKFERVREMGFDDEVRDEDG